MSRTVPLMLVLGLSLAVVASGWAADANPEQGKAVPEIEKLGGRVTVDAISPDKPVKSVDLASSEVTDAGMVNLKGLTQLQVLNLAGTKVTDTGLVHLKGLAQLQSLNLWNTKVTDAGLTNLKGLTKLQTLVLGRTNVTDAGMVHLKGLPQLQMLDLAGTTMTDAGLADLKGLTKLQVLNLEGTNVTDAGMVHLEGLTQLQTLVLVNTKVTDAGIEHLEGLTQLQRLYRGETKVSDDGVEHLEGLTQLQHLDLIVTKVSNEGVKKLQQELPKCEISSSPSEKPVIADATSKKPEVLMEVVSTSARDMEIRRLKVPDGWLVFTKWFVKEAPGTPDHSHTMCLFYPDPEHRWDMQSSPRRSEEAQIVPTPPLRSLGANLTVDKNGIIWDQAKPVGVWGVDGENENMGQLEVLR